VTDTHHTSDPIVQSLPSQADAQKLAERVFTRIKAKEAFVEIEAEQPRKAEFARNQLLQLEGETVVKVSLQVNIEGRRARVETHDLSHQGLAALVDEAEGIASQRVKVGPTGLLPPPATIQTPKHLYAEATAKGGLPEEQARLVQHILQQSQDADVLAAGSLQHETSARLIRSTTGYGGYTRSSYSEFSLSARTAKQGAGWAWGGTEDASKVKPQEVARRAIDLARRSENPVAVEPGRYTVILEPEALAQLLDLTVRWTTFYMSLVAAESRGNVFTKPGGGSRIGEQMTDRRVQFYYDPSDALLPFSPLSGATRIQRTHWLENGVLKNLAVDAGLAKERGIAAVVNPLRARLDVSGHTQTIEQMIASTKRGIWVHHFSGINMVDWETLLLSGVTRNGTFLIENGKVSRPVRNLRFTESPFFLLNKLDAAGPAVRAHRMIACPRLKIHDFEFTALSDAI
jgi:predicted Zn-dependent protease